ncbi:unnamed protein product [Strongylus vulgaris]|uniref:Uncharacterized protein n=1 Tax=Strongylus vulgaris TaxID=40348 RepID=A0A3P7IZA6_STRVU|nr:unnamed protein product [Strongylus vulgaris]
MKSFAARETYSFIVGVNDYHDVGLLKVKQGYFMYTVKEVLWDYWKDFVRKKKIRRKFTAYSTQDWLVLAYLHALGCGPSALGTTVPKYNGMVIIELYEGSKKPFVKVYYKDNTMEVPKDITKSVRTCAHVPCHLIEFDLGPKSYLTKNLQEAEQACHGLS